MDRGEFIEPEFIYAIVACVFQFDILFTIIIIIWNHIVMSKLFILHSNTW